MRLARLVASRLALPLAAAACSGSSLTLASGPTEQTACGDLAAAYCAQIDHCAPIALAEDYGSVSACASRRAELCENSLAAPGTGATPATTEACVVAFATYSCADFNNDVVPAACRPQVGNGPAGSACAFAAQCQSAFCQIAKGSVCGACSASPGAGSPCAASNCPTGLHCATSTQTCVTYGALNDPCAINNDCGYSLDCVGADATLSAEGKCTAEIQTAGASCDHALKTGPGCDPTHNLFCGKDETCDAYGTAATGQSCAYVNGASTYTYCVAGASCLQAVAGVGTCTGPALDEAPCDTASADGCLAPAVCVGATVDGGVTGTCQIASAASCH